MSGMNRGTGLLIIEVRNSNPNGDPDAESEHRTLEADGRGLISPVSFKRKLRDLIGAANGPVWQAAVAALLLGSEGEANVYGILETRGRDRNLIGKMGAEEFSRTYWDGRVFGNTFLEAVKDAPDVAADKSKKKPAEEQKASREHFISTGVVQFGPGISIAPIEVDRLTTTNKAGVQEGKDRGMAPLGWRVVRHAIYAMPLLVNPAAAGKTGCQKLDIDILKFVLPHAYSNTASAIRPFVEIRHAWYAEHCNPLGSCPDSRILDAMTPRKRERPGEPSQRVDEYDIPTSLPEEVKARLASIEDLCTKSWK